MFFGTSILGFRIDFVGWGPPPPQVGKGGGLGGPPLPGFYLAFGILGPGFPGQGGDNLAFGIFRSRNIV